MKQIQTFQIHLFQMLNKQALESHNNTLCHLFRKIQ